MEVGGAETLVSQMCRLQRKQGHDPHVYAVAALGLLGEQLQRDGFHVEANVGKHLLDSNRSFFQIFKKLRPDVVHLHNPTPTIYAAAPARLAGVPSIVSTRHSLVAPPHPLVPELKYACAATFCDWIVGICDATVNNLRSLHMLKPRKIVRIYNGTDAVVKVAEENCPPKDGFTLLYVGRLVPVKNHDMLLLAFHLALSSLPNLRLWMVGDGSERQRLESMASELGIATKVTFWGQQLDVSRFFSAADAFIMSSKSEGLPMSLIQAFSVGLPAIVTNVGGMGEVVRQAGAGYSVRADDFREMAAAIQSVATNDAERKNFSLAAEASFQSQFKLEAMVKSYSRLYMNSGSHRRISIS